ncbi:P-loop containing nucleoside triphosphate hydrolase protein [Dipodascopsis tothii]|uniref:P-loop containing nucleoside triphosphate hydrolase protein n=1 Tax=Dipodascopsis tothii TaxID=44089 RepID=UPI0034CF9014
MDDDFNYGYSSSDEGLLVELASKAERADSGPARRPAPQIDRKENAGRTESMFRVAPLRQVSLFGSALNGAPRGPLARPLFKPAYETARALHSFNEANLGTYVYPTNKAVREYQLRIAERALLNNVLVALPTGLGKTLIASVVMLNWYRWTTTAKIIFMAPTRPLVAQQVEACLQIAGLPREDTAMLVGSTAAPATRRVQWDAKRVFFVTPQTLDNDLKKGVVDPKSIVCLVVDEAHRATGDYAYSQVVKFVRRFNPQVRVLALSATPGSSVEAVQQVIENLFISHAEIRTETSADVAPYVSGAEIQHVAAGSTADIDELLGYFETAVGPLVQTLNRQNALPGTEPLQLSLYRLVLARKDYRASGAFGAAGREPLGWMVDSIFKLLIRMAHGLALLRNHGIRQFLSYMRQVRDEMYTSRKTKGNQAKALFGSEAFNLMVSRAEQMVAADGFVNHEKSELLVATLTEFFADAENVGRESKVIVFTEFRSTAKDLVATAAGVDGVRPHVFMGQAARESDVETEAGMSQKEQQAVVDGFRRGDYNVLVATSIGEEGLDIGQVDLIVCYDSSASPVRMVQRMGRTGRFRRGRVVALLTEQERSKWDKALAKYSEIQAQIADTSMFNFNKCYRILPDDVTPVCVRTHIEIPPENLAPPEEVTNAAKWRGKGKPAKPPPKRFFMPDGVETTFTTAGSLVGGAAAPAGPAAARAPRVRPAPARKRSLTTDAVGRADMPADYGLLSPAEEADLRARYQTLAGAAVHVRHREYDPVECVRRNRGADTAVHIHHSAATRRLAAAVAALRVPVRPRAPDPALLGAYAPAAPAAPVRADSGSDSDLPDALDLLRR